MPAGSKTIGKQLKAPEIGAFLRFRAAAKLLLACVLLISLSVCAGESSEVVSVRHVLDGDTLILESGEKVRLIGINAPEKARQNLPAEAFSLEATLALKKLVEGREVRLIYGKQKRDRYGRVLGYVELINGRDIQQILLQRGYGYVVAFPPDIGRLNRYMEAENAARKSRLGVWKNPFIGDLDQREKHLPGFGIFKGMVEEIFTSPRTVQFKFRGNIIVTVAVDRWTAFWTEQPASLIGKKIEARGWLTAARGKENKNRFYLKVRHPSMMRTVTD